MSRYDTYAADFQMTDTRPAEVTVLAGILYNQALLETAKLCISENNFHNEECRVAWKVINNIVENHEPVNYDVLESRGLSQTFLAELVSDSHIPSTDNGMEACCRTLKVAGVKRMAHVIGLELLRTSSDPLATDQDIYSFSERIAAEVLDSSNDSDLITIDQAMDELTEEVRMRKDGRIKPTETGIESLDNLLCGGYEPAELVILAARPSVGKTAVMLQLVESAARGGAAAAVFSLEMSNAALAKRYVTSGGSVRSWEISTGAVSIQDLKNEAARFRGLPIRLCDKAFSLESLESLITRAHQRGQCDVAFIDYLGLIGGMKGASLYQQVTDTTRRLKMLAKKLNIPVILLCQLNRGSSSDSRSPELYDLRDSGSIEQDADIVLMLENPSRAVLDSQFKEISGEYDDESIKKVVLLWVRKNRRGVRNMPVMLEATNGYSRFVEPSATTYPSYRPEPVQGDIDLP